MAEKMNNVHEDGFPCSYLLPHLGDLKILSDYCYFFLELIIHPSLLSLALCKLYVIKYFQILGMHVKIFFH